MRLKNRDYSAPGFYFVTICASQKRCVLGRLKDKRVELSSLGQIVRECWVNIPIHFARVNLHSFVIMPNHLHGIIEIADTERAQDAEGVQGTRAEVARTPLAGSLSVIVRSFKAEVSRRGREELRWPGRLWQPNYFDRVIRDGRELSHVSRYIAENPLRWQSDLENPGVASLLSEKERQAQHAARLQGNHRSGR